MIRCTRRAGFLFLILSILSAGCKSEKKSASDQIIERALGLAGYETTLESGGDHYTVAVKDRNGAFQSFAKARGSGEPGTPERMLDRKDGLARPDCLPSWVHLPADGVIELAMGNRNLEGGTCNVVVQTKWKKDRILRFYSNQPGMKTLGQASQGGITYTTLVRKKARCFLLIDEPSERQAYTTVALGVLNDWDAG